MAMTVLMKQTRQGDAGAVLSAGSTYTVTEKLGAELVGVGFATDVTSALQTGRGVQVMAEINGVTGGIEIYGQVVVSNLVLNSTTSATTNTSEIQKALDTGGNVFAGGSGVIYINSTLLIGDDTSLTLGGGTVIRLAPLANCNMLRTKNWGSPTISVSSLSSADGISATATCAHGQTVGSSKWMFVYGATPEAYNGVYYVAFTDSTHFTFAVSKDAPSETLTTPATGTISCMLANGNISLDGGTWDYDSTSQTTPDTLQKHAIYLRRVGNLSFGAFRVLNSTKYAIHVVNVKGFQFNALVFDTASDGLHIGGSAKQIQGGVIRGKTGDDLFAITQGEYPQYFDAGYIIGAFEDIYVSQLVCDRGFAAFKLCPQGSNLFSDIGVGRISGVFSGGAAFVNATFDSGIVQQDGTTPCVNGTIKSIKIGALENRQLSSKPQVIVGCTVSTLQLNNVTVNTGSTSGSSTVVTVDATGVLTNLQGNNWDVSGATTAAIAVLVVGSGSLGSVNISNANFSTLKAVVQLNSTSLSNGTLTFTNVWADAMSTFINTAVRGVGSVPIPAFFSNVRYTNPAGGLLTGLGAGSQVAAQFSGCVIPAGAAVSGTWTNVTADYSPDQRDVVTYAATITPDYSKGQLKICTFTAAMTIAAPTNLFTSNNQVGRQITFVLIRNSVGAAAITWNSVYKFPTAFTDSAANTTRTVVSFRSDDNGNYICVSGANAWN